MEKLKTEYEISHDAFLKICEIAFENVINKEKKKDIKRIACKYCNKTVNETSLKIHYKSKKCQIKQKELIKSLIKDI